jgi:CheY-like chemotaxis protein
MSKTVLIVDDDVDITEQHKMILESASFSSIVANNVDEAWKALETNHIDLILLDVMMEKNTDGFNMAQKLKSMDIIKEIPIIMVTSVNQKMPFTFDKDSDGAFLPVEKFMEKPIEPHQLLHAVRELVKD